MRQPATRAGVGVTADRGREPLDVRVVHALPGRVRLRIPALKDVPQFAETFRAAAVAHEGTRDVHVNAWSRSATIEYDPGVLTLREALAVAATPPPRPRRAGRQTSSRRGRAFLTLTSPPRQLAAGGAALLASTLGVPVALTVGALGLAVCRWCRGRSAWCGTSGASGWTRSTRSPR